MKDIAHLLDPRVPSSAAAAAIICSATRALRRRKTFAFADQGDALSMDPHSLNESFQLSLHRQHLRAADRSRQAARGACPGWLPTGSRPRPPSGASICEGRDVPRRHALYRR